MQVIFEVTNQVATNAQMTINWWSLGINAVIALIAIFALVGSFWFSRRTLRQTKELNEDAQKQTLALFKTQSDIQLFEVRQKNLVQCLELFEEIMHNYNEKGNEYPRRILLSVTGIRSLFTESDEIYKGGIRLVTALRKKSSEGLPDRTIKFAKYLKDYNYDKTDKIAAYIFHLRLEVLILFDQLNIKL